MKKTSKIVSALLVLSMSVSMCLMPAAHAEEEYTYDHSSESFVAGTDFENRYNVSGFETHGGDFVSGLTPNENAELSSVQKHSGQYSLHSKGATNGNAAIYTDEYAWAYWNANVSQRKLTAGKAYKYSYWVYADEAATVFTPNTLVSNGKVNDYDWIIKNNNYSCLSKETWNYFEVVFTAKTTDLPFFYGIPANLYIDDIKLEEVAVPKMTATTLPAEGKTTSVGRNRYTMTFDKDIASATVKVGTSTVTNTISNDKKTVSFEVLFEKAEEKTVVVDVTDTDGATAQVTRTFTIRDTWVAFADFDRNSTEYEDFANAGEWGFFSSCAGGTHSQAQAHSGKWSYYSGTSGAKGNAEIGGSWSWWKLSKTLEIGKAYKYSYWVYADEAATAFTPNTLVSNGKVNDYDHIIENRNYSGLSKGTWNYFEVVFMAKTTDLPFFYDIPANLYIDDILLEEIPQVNAVGTTLPDEGTNAALGYNEYTMTFDKDIASAKVTYNGNTTEAIVNKDGKTISFGLATVKDGNVLISIKDSDGLDSVVTRAITVPDTLVFYTGFDRGATAGYYVYNNYWETPLEAKEYRSPGAALRLVTTEPYGLCVDVVSDRLDGTQYSKVDEGSVVFTKGKWYKVSFYGKTGETGKNPQIGVARRDVTGRGYGVSMFTMTDEMTKYEVTFKALSDKKPFLYREKLDSEIIIDDLLVEAVEPPVDYTYSLSASEVKANAAITATLSNEKLDAINGVAIIALYKDGMLQECQLTSVTSLAKGEEVTTAAVTVPEDISDGEYTVRAFLWNDIDSTLSPKCAAKEITESAAQ